jgi:hypothetical protein
MKQINIKHITNLHNDALRGLDFYQQELIILRDRLEEVAAQNTALEVLEKVEHFQNQFIIHRRHLEDLKSEFHKNLKHLESQVMEMAGFVEQVTFTENGSLYESYLTEEKIFNDLRHEFNRFAAQWL